MRDQDRPEQPTKRPRPKAEDREPLSEAEDEMRNQDRPGEPPKRPRQGRGWGATSSDYSTQLRLRLKQAQVGLDRLTKTENGHGQDDNIGLDNMDNW